MKATRRIYGSRLKVTIGVIDKTPSITFDVPSSEILNGDFYLNMRSKETGEIAELGLYGEITTEEVKEAVADPYEGLSDEELDRLTRPNNEAPEESKEETPTITDLKVYEIVVAGFINKWSDKRVEVEIRKVKSYSEKYARQRATFIKNVILAFLGKYNNLPRASKITVRRILNHEKIKFNDLSRITNGSILNVLTAMKRTSLIQRIKWSVGNAPIKEETWYETVPASQLDNYELIMYGLIKKWGKFTISDKLISDGRLSKKAALALVNSFLNCMHSLNGEYNGAAQKTLEAAQWFLGNKDVPKPTSSVLSTVVRTYNTMKRFNMDADIKFIK